MAATARFFSPQVRSVFSIGVISFHCVPLSDDGGPGFINLSPAEGLPSGAGSFPGAAGLQNGA